MNTTVERIPLAERLRRLEEGYASSPQVTGIFAETFCRTKIVPALEEFGAYYERAKFAELLGGEIAQEIVSAFNADGSPDRGLEDMTFGDLAILISSRYLKEENVQSMVTEKLICIYFHLIEALVVQKNRKREELLPLLKPIYDFLHMSFNEYYEYAKLCGLDEYAEKIDAFRTARGFSSRMTLLMIFEELKMEFWQYDMICFDLSSQLLTVEQSRHFIDFFVCPVAMIRMRSIINRSQRGVLCNV